MPSQAILEQKQVVVDQIVNKFNNANSVIVVNYQGLNVEALTALRKQLREAGVEFKVYKNTLTRRACETAGYEGLTEFLTGPNAVAFSGEDVVAPAKILAEFAKKHEELEIKTGVIEGEVVGLDTIGRLASLPDRDGLLTMLAGAMLAPLRDLSISLHLYTEENGENKEEVAEEAAE